MLCGMTMPHELEAWLTARFEREREATLALVLKLLESMLNETLRRDGESYRSEFAGEFAKLQSIVAEYQCTVDRLQGLIEQMQRLDRAALGEHSTKMN